MSGNSVALKKQKNGALFLVKKCCVCGFGCAPFGSGVDIMGAVGAGKKGNKTLYNRLLGKWYCADCNQTRKGHDGK